MFTAQVPAGYRRIKIMRHATVTDGTLDATAEQQPASGRPAAPASATPR
jgi:hypothetical protein